jgi:hypothetical protein
MTNQSTTTPPKSAISTWGGFVYQGKVALYHAVKLLFDGEFNGNAIPTFQLLLDSTDDFAIYVNNKAISIHQVKAKVSTYRSTFDEALDKSSRICTDTIKNTKRYFHIAQAIDDDSDYTKQANTIVEFYGYDDKRKYCPIDQIAVLTQQKITQYLTKNSPICTNPLAEKAYIHLSEMVSKKVLEIHAAIHAGQSQNDAAYENRIESDCIKKLLETDFNKPDDVEYTLAKLRLTFAETFESYIADNEFSDIEIERAKRAFVFISRLDNSKLQQVLESLRPHSPTDDPRFDDLQNYADIIMGIAYEMSFQNFPHYSKNTNKYLPTAMRLDKKESRRISLEKSLNEQIRDNPNLIRLLYEFDTFIAYSEVEAPPIQYDTEKVTKFYEENAKNNTHLVKPVSMRIISNNIAKGELSD